MALPPSCPAIRSRGITVLYGDHESSIDIVFVHGLGGNPEATWKHDSGYFWPFELRNFAKDARVMVYGYDTDLTQGLSANLIRIKDLGTNLLGSLVNKRQDDEELRRPLIFVGHSLGGLIIKQALFLASLNANTGGDDWDLIYHSTKGLMFFGTPHLGSGAGDLMRVKLATLVARAVLVKTPRKIDDALKLHSDELLDLSDNFRKTTMWTERRVEVYTFYETRSDPRLGGDVVVDAVSAKLGYDKETSISIQATHQGMVKFEDEGDADFESVCGKVKRLKRYALNSGSNLDPDQNLSSSRTPSYPAFAIAPVKAFVPRQSLLDSVKEQLSRESGDGREQAPRKVGIWGLGGMGKSQLALSYVQRYGRDYAATFWIDAQDPTSVDKCFLEIYQSLSLDASLDGLAASDQVRYAILHWFNTKAGPWLMVFDGADELSSSDRNFVDLLRYTPRSPNVHVIATSRSRMIRDYSTFEGVEVGKFPPAKAAELLLRCAGLSSRTDPDAVEQIVKELDYLPLAISIAGSYIERTPRLSEDPFQYLHEHRQRKHTLLRQHPDSFSNPYSHSVMTVWEASYFAVQHELPAACQILTLLAFLDNQDIYVDLLVPRPPVNPAFSFNARQSWRAAIGLTDDICIENILSILERRSLLNRRENNSSYSMHKLVHTWSLDRLRGAQEVQNFALAALRLLCDASDALGPWKPDRQAALRLSAHIKESSLVLSRLQMGLEEEDSEILDGLEYLGCFLSRSGSWRDASLILGIALEKIQQSRGDNNRRAIEVMFHSADALVSQARCEEAEAILSAAHDKAQQVPEGQDSIINEMGTHLGLVANRKEFWERLWMQSRIMVEHYEASKTNTSRDLELVYSTKEAHRKALAQMVDAMSNLERNFGKGHVSVKATRDFLMMGVIVDLSYHDLIECLKTEAEDAQAVSEIIAKFIAMYQRHGFNDVESQHDLCIATDEVARRSANLAESMKRTTELSRKVVINNRTLQQLFDKANNVLDATNDLGIIDKLWFKIKRVFR